MKRMIKRAGKAIGLSLVVFACLLEPGHVRLFLEACVTGVCLCSFCIYHDLIEEMRADNARRNKLRRQFRY